MLGETRGRSQYKLMAGKKERAFYLFCLLFRGLVYRKSLLPNVGVDKWSSVHSPTDNNPRHLGHYFQVNTLSLNLCIAFSSDLSFSSLFVCFLITKKYCCGFLLIGKSAGVQHALSVYLINWPA